MINFTLNEAIKTANQLTYKKLHRYLTDVEIIVLEGAWDRQEYDEIAAKNQYATSYISQDVAPKMWKFLTDALGEKVKKSNFKEALKRFWLSQFIECKNDQFQDNLFEGISRHYRVVKHEENFSSLTPDIYIERFPVEKICYEKLLQPGSLIRIKAPKLMGKTYLVDKILAEIARQNYRTINLSFELADRSTHFSDLNKFLRWFCLNLSRELGLTSDLDEYWDEEGMGAKVSCTTYFEEYLLAQADTPLVLCLDDVDLLFPYPHIYEDFFGLLRSWYEKARSRQAWKNLRLIIVHSTDVYTRLNLNQSPFNIGLPIELSEFTWDQIVQFAQEYELNLDSGMLEKLVEVVGGHPYLLEVAFSHLKINPSITLEQLLTEAVTDAGIYSHHLRDRWLDLHINPELTEAFRKVVTAKSPVQLSPMVAYQLNSMGLVKISGNMVTPRCNLYRQYFQMHWLG